MAYHILCQVILSERNTVSSVGETVPLDLGRCKTMDDILAVMCEQYPEAFVAVCLKNDMRNEMTISQGWKVTGSLVIPGKDGADVVACSKQFLFDEDVSQFFTEVAKVVASKSTEFVSLKEADIEIFNDAYDVDENNARELEAKPFLVIHVIREKNSFPQWMQKMDRSTMRKYVKEVTEGLVASVESAFASSNECNDFEIF